MTLSAYSPNVVEGEFCEVRNDGVLRSSRRLLRAYCTDIGPRGKSSLTARALYKNTIDAVILPSGSNNYEIRCKG